MSRLEPPATTATTAVVTPVLVVIRPIEVPVWLVGRVRVMVAVLVAVGGVV